MLKNIIVKLMYELMSLYDHLMKVFGDDTVYSILSFDTIEYFYTDLLF